MSMMQRSKDKERFWRGKVRQWRRSGLSVRVFCAEHHLSEPSFYGWRRTLAERDAAAVPFAPVRIVPEREPMTEAAADGLELILSGGRRLRIGSSFDAPTLQRLLALLEEDRP